MRFNTKAPALHEEDNDVNSLLKLQKVYTTAKISTKKMCKLSF
mgnify:CR=1 FL=1